MQSELKGFGPNVAVWAASGAAMDPGPDVPGARLLAGTANRFIILGAEPEMRNLCPWWSVEGRWPGPGECLRGARLPHLGGQVTLGGRNFRVSGVLFTGGPEDGYWVIPLQEAQSLLGLPGKITSIQFRAQGDLSQVAALARGIESRHPELRAEPVFEIAKAEERVLARIQGVFVLAAAAVLVSAAVSAFAAVSAAIVERRRELGLLVSLGASQTGVVRLLLADVLVVALGGATLGGAAGAWLGRAMGRHVFQSTLDFRPEVLAATLAGLALLATAAVFVAARPVFRLSAASVLREE